MKVFTILSAVLLLAGCPTPPETVSPSNNPGTNVTPPQQNNPPPTQGTEAGENGAPPADDGAAEGRQDPPAGGDENPPPADGAENPPPADNGGGGGDLLPPGGGPESGMVIEIQDAQDDEGPPQLSQDEIKEGEHVTFSGKISCDSYKGSLILRVTKAPSGGGDAGEGDESDFVTQHILSGPGAFSLALPKTDEMLILEILADTNGDGKPTIGERFAIYMLTGKLSPSKDRTGLDIEVGI